MNIKRYLKKKEAPKLIQARMDPDLHEKLRIKLKLDGVKIGEFIEAAAKAYLDEK